MATDLAKAVNERITLIPAVTQPAPALLALDREKMLGTGTYDAAVI